MNPDPRDIIGRNHNNRLKFLGRLLADKLFFDINPSEGFEINTWDGRDRFTRGEELDPYTERPCVYSKFCPRRTEHEGFYEVVQTSDSGIMRYFLHMECAKVLADKVDVGENP